MSDENNNGVIDFESSSFNQNVGSIKNVEAPTNEATANVDSNGIVQGNMVESDQTNSFPASDINVDDIFGTWDSSNSTQAEVKPISNDYNNSNIETNDKELPLPDVDDIFGSSSVNSDSSMPITDNTSKENANDLLPKEEVLSSDSNIELTNLALNSIANMHSNNDFGSVNQAAVLPKTKEEFNDNGDNINSPATIDGTDLTNNNFANLASISADINSSLANGNIQENNADDDNNGSSYVGRNVNELFNNQETANNNVTTDNQLENKIVNNQDQTINNVAFSSPFEPNFQQINDNHENLTDNAYFTNTISLDGQNKTENNTFINNPNLLNEQNFNNVNEEIIKQNNGVSTFENGQISSINENPMIDSGSNEINQEFSNNNISYVTSQNVSNQNRLNDNLLENPINNNVNLNNANTSNEPFVTSGQGIINQPEGFNGNNINANFNTQGILENSQPFNQYNNSAFNGNNGTFQSSTVAFNNTVSDNGQSGNNNIANNSLGGIDNNFLNNQVVQAVSLGSPADLHQALSTPDNNIALASSVNVGNMPNSNVTPSIPNDNTTDNGQVSDKKQGKISLPVVMLILIIVVSVGVIILKRDVLADFFQTLMRK